METLVSIIKRVQKFKTPPGQLILYSPAYGTVEFYKFSDNGGIQVKDYSGDVFMLDAYGRLHPKGCCMLFPETKESWETYLNAVINKFYDSKLRIGDVCLAKETETSDWVLAIYDGKFDGQYRAKASSEVSTWRYCISYSENSSYLGRSMFPDWMLPEENE